VGDVKILLMMTGLIFSCNWAVLDVPSICIATETDCAVRIDIEVMDSYPHEGKTITFFSTHASTNHFEYSLFVGRDLNWINVSCIEQTLFLFRCVSIVMKSTCYLCHVHPSAWFSTAPTGRISMKFDIWDFMKISQENPNFFKIWQKYEMLYTKT
jgi:hypothetical protein